MFPSGLANSQVVVDFGEAHLRRILRAYVGYYNDIRTHWSLDKDAPVSRPARGDELRALRKLQREAPKSPFIFVSERKACFLRGSLDH